MEKLMVLFLVLFVVAPCLADSITMQWDPLEKAPDGYRLYQRVDGQPYDYANPVVPSGMASPDISPGTTSATVDGLDSPAGVKTTYYWVVRSFVGANMSADSNEISYQVDRVAPNAITDLAASYVNGTGEINLTWTQPGTEAPAYWKAYFSETQGGPYTELATIQNTGQAQVGASVPLSINAGEMKVFCFVVIGFKSENVYSANSNEVCQSVDMRALAPINTLRIIINVIN